jgi:hypothetical protein
MTARSGRRGSIGMRQGHRHAVEDGMFSGTEFLLGRDVLNE